jgi:hypothetical protein
MAVLAINPAYDCYSETPSLIVRCRVSCIGFEIMSQLIRRQHKLPTLSKYISQGIVYHEGFVVILGHLLAFPRLVIDQGLTRGYHGGC